MRIDNCIRFDFPYDDYFWQICPPDSVSFSAGSCNCHFCDPGTFGKKSIARNDRGSCASHAHSTC